jgi:hypothetical protein
MSRRTTARRGSVQRVWTRQVWAQQGWAQQGWALAGALALTVGATLAVPSSAMADGNPKVDVSTLANPTLDDALINILSDQGINYEPVTDARSAYNAGGPDTTLVIDSDETLDSADLQLLSSGTFGRIVLLTDDAPTLTAFLPTAGISTALATATADISPACTAPNVIAGSAGTIENPGPTFTYDYPAAASSPTTATGTAVEQACYPVADNPSMVELSSGPNGTDTILLGSTTFLENQYLADDGNADLAMRIFGGHENLVWLATEFTNDATLDCGNSQCLNSGGANGNGQNGGGSNGNGNGTTTTVSPGPNTSISSPTLTSLMPTWIWWVLAQIVLAVLLIAYWRARRQGRIVAEPLPVTVRAAETVEGHARLYRRAGAFGHSAQLLRQAAAGRLAPLFGLPQARAEAEPGLLVAPVAARLGVDPGLVGDLLAGPAPTSEAELVLLADHLDQLEQEVRSS